MLMNSIRNRGLNPVWRLKAGQHLFGIINLAQKKKNLLPAPDQVSHKGLIGIPIPGWVGGGGGVML